MRSTDCDPRNVDGEFPVRERTGLPMPPHSQTALLSKIQFQTDKFSQDLRAETRASERPREWRPDALSDRFREPLRSRSRPDARSKIVIGGDQSIRAHDSKVRECRQRPTAALTQRRFQETPVPRERAVVFQARRKPQGSRPNPDAGCERHVSRTILAFGERDRAASISAQTARPENDRAERKNQKD